MLYTILGIIIVFLAWMQAAYGKMQKYKNDARSQWVRIDALLQTRSQYILGMLELADEKGLDAGDILEQVYDMAGGYCKSDDREIISTLAEEVTPLSDRLMELADNHPSLKDDDDYLELKAELAEVEEEIENQSERYNSSIERYNSHIETPVLKPQIAILGAPHLRGIHIR